MGTHTLLVVIHMVKLLWRTISPPLVKLHVSRVITCICLPIDVAEHTCICLPIDVAEHVFIYVYPTYIGRNLFHKYTLKDIFFWSYRKNCKITYKFIDRRMDQF